MVVKMLAAKMMYNALNKSLNRRVNELEELIKNTEAVDRAVRPKVIELENDKLPKLRDASMKYPELLLPERDEKKINEILEEQSCLKDKADQVLETAKIYLVSPIAEYQCWRKLMQQRIQRKF